MNVCVMSDKNYLDILITENESKLNYLNNLFDSVINEKSNNDEFNYLLEAEDKENETNKKSKGILGKIISTITSFFKHIKEFLFGKADEVDESKLPEKVELPANPEEVMKESDNTLSAISQFLSSKKGKLLGIVSGAAFTFGAYRCGKKHVKPLIKALKRYADTIINRTEAINKQIENSNLNQEEIGFVRKGLNRVAQIKNTISSIIKAIPHMSDPEFKNIHEEEKRNAGISTDDNGKKTRSQKKVEKHASKAEDILEKAKNTLAEKENLLEHYNEELKILKNVESEAKKRLKEVKSSATKGDSFFDTLKNKGNRYLYFRILGKDRDKVSRAETNFLSKISTEYGTVFSTNKATVAQIQKDIVKVKNNIEIVQRSIINVQKEIAEAKKAVSNAELNLAKINTYDKAKANS